MLTFSVDGEPATKGSAAPYRKRDGKLGVRNDNQRCAGWQEAVGWAAKAALAEHYAKGGFIRAPVSGNVRVEVEFRLDDKSRAKDADKMLRPILDALTGIVYEDDEQVVFVSGRKVAGTPGATVRVEVP